MSPVQRLRAGSARRRIPIAAIVTVLGLAAALPIANAVTAAPTVSSSAAGPAMPTTGTDPAAETPVLSATGRYVAFTSPLSSLVPGDTNSARDVFRLDRTDGSVQRVSVDSSGGQADGDSYLPSISADGRYVAFTSAATNLTSSTVQVQAVYLHDMQTGATTLASAGSGGGPFSTTAGSSAGAGQQAVSDDGRFVVFASATALNPGTRTDVYLRDRTAGTTTKVSVGLGGAVANGSSFDAGISGDGSHVVFASNASNLVAGDTNGARDVFTRDLAHGTTSLVSTSGAGAIGDHDSGQPSVSQDGAVVAFVSSASNLVAGDTNGLPDIFVRRPASGTTSLVGPSGVRASGLAGDARVSRDGTAVAFVSKADNLVAGDTNYLPDVFLARLADSSVVRVDLGAGGVQANGTSGAPAIDASGHIVGFISAASNLVPSDGNSRPDLFLRDVSAGSTTIGTPVGVENLAVDGSFEPPDLPSESYFDSFGLPSTTQLGAWRIDRGGVDLIHDVNVPDGLQFIDLNGNGFDPGQISQAITVQDHHRYTVSFVLSGNSNGPPTVKTLDVSFAGTTKSFSADTTGHTTADPGWTGHSFDVGACGVTSSRLVFNSTTPNVDGGQKGPQLDAISVVDITGTAGEDPCTGPPANGSTSTAVTSSVNPSVSGQSVTWTAKVSSGGQAVGAGTVQWKVDGTNAGSPAAVVGGSATLHQANLAVGSHTIEADFLGADGFDPSQGTLTQRVGKGATTTAVTSSANPVTWGQAATFTATVAPKAPATIAAGPPSGTVSFSIDGSAAGSVPLTNGSAALQATLPPGPHQVVASYAGDAQFTASTSPVFTETVTCDRTYTTTIASLVVSSGTACVIGGSVTGSATVSGSGSLAIVNGTVGGNVVDNSGGRLLLCGTHVVRSVTSQGARQLVVVGDPAIGCAGNTIDGSLVLVGNTAGVEAIGNRIGGSLTDRANTNADIHDNQTHLLT